MNLQRLLVHALIVVLPIELYGTINIGLRVPLFFFVALVLETVVLLNDPMRLFSRLKLSEGVFFYFLAIFSAIGVARFSAPSWLVASDPIRVSPLRPLLQAATLIGYFLLPAAIRVAVPTVRDLKRVLRTQTVVGSGVVLLAVYQTVAIRVGLPLGRLPTSDPYFTSRVQARFTAFGSDVPRVLATFGEPKTLAAYLLFFIALLLFPKALDLSRPTRLLLLGGALFALGATYALAAILALPFLLVSALLLNGQRSLGAVVRKGAMMTILLGAILLIPLPASGGRSILTEARARDISAESATAGDSYRLAYTQFVVAPVVGRGLGERPILVAEDSLTTSLGGSSAGFFLEFAVETGLVGLLFALILIGSAITRGVRSARHSSNVVVASTSGAMACFLVAWCVQALNWGGAYSLLSMGFSLSGILWSTQSIDTLVVHPLQSAGRP